MFCDDNVSGRSCTGPIRLDAVLSVVPVMAAQQMVGLLVAALQVAVLQVAVLKVAALQEMMQ